MNCDKRRWNPGAGCLNNESGANLSFNLQLLLFLDMKNYREGKAFRFEKQAKDLSSIEDKQHKRGGKEICV